MWFWIVIVAVFLYLFFRFLQENQETTRSGFAALVGTLADGAALVALTLGIFGLLIALMMGFFGGPGPRLVGEGLTGTLLYSAGLLALGVLLFLLSGGIRRLGGRGAPKAAVSRGH
ncbi:hypothetical protein [Falsiroseomonas selenitidurans]|uniref:MotA/TolQ/ExbB proton channel domain-containing protein n=1 Tax=Falsiroseomonas selenitidurans TaxID=2716335 RepID=A0ABX1E5Z7_9PROT|nr:hypothetical protein [Falsiroseomonas selenitidurans]NKC32418.1 hypothetical protein [Falsiroseomonas selenitidurans]